MAQIRILSCCIQMLRQRHSSSHHRQTGSINEHFFPSPTPVPNRLISLSKCSIISHSHRVLSQERSFPTWTRFCVRPRLHCFLDPLHFGRLVSLPQRRPAQGWLLTVCARAPATQFAALPQPLVPYLWFESARLSLQHTREFWFSTQLVAAPIGTRLA